VVAGLVRALLTVLVAAVVDQLTKAKAASGGASNDREWFYRVDSIRYDLDIDSLIVGRRDSAIRPISVGMPVLQPYHSTTLVKIAAWNVANLSTTEASLAYLTTVLNSNKLDLLALTETHLTDDLLLGRLRTMNWNVEVRERHSASTGGVAIVIHKSWDYDLIHTDDENIICVHATHPSLQIKYLVIGVYVLSVAV
jgi:hypothetical protein